MESERNWDLFSIHIFFVQRKFKETTHPCYKYFRTVCLHWHFHFLKWNPDWPTGGKKGWLCSTALFQQAHPYGKNFLWWLIHSCQTSTFLCVTRAEVRSVEAQHKSLNHLIVFYSYLNLHLSQTQCVHHENLHSSNITGKKNPIPMGLFLLDSLWNFWGMFWALFPVLHCWVITHYWIPPKMCWIQILYSHMTPVVFTICKGKEKKKKKT